MALRKEKHGGNLRAITPETINLFGVAAYKEEALSPIAGSTHTLYLLKHALQKKQ